MFTDPRVIGPLVLGLLITGTVIAAVLLLRAARTNRMLLDRRQVGLRLVGLVVLLAIWALLGMILYLLFGQHPSAYLRQIVTLFYATLVLALVLPLLALLDLRLLRLTRAREELRLAEDVIRAVSTRPVTRHES